VGIHIGNDFLKIVKPIEALLIGTIIMADHYAGRTVCICVCVCVLCMTICVSVYLCVHVFVCMYVYTQIRCVSEKT
jgi:hypothetical protein